MKTNRLYNFTDLYQVQAQLNERDAQKARNREMLDIILTALAYGVLVAGAFVCPAMILALMN